MLAQQCALLLVTQACQPAATAPPLPAPCSTPRCRHARPLASERRCTDPCPVFKISQRHRAVWSGRGLAAGHCHGRATVQSACLAVGDNKIACMARPGPCRKALPRTRRVHSGPALCTTPAPARWPPRAAGSSKRLSHRDCVPQLINTRQELPKAYWPRLERGRAARQCRVRAAVHQAPLNLGTASSTLHQAGQPPLDPIGV